MCDVKKILKEVWGYEQFRPLQRDVIDSVCAGSDTIALMPTGGGKSLTYQIPTLATDGICIVITPLIALMKDQVDSLRKKGILAAGIHSGMSLQKIESTLNNCLFGGYKFLYIAPERIPSDIFSLTFAEMNVSLIAVDEAHCISEWGHDFRPAYLNISKLREIKPEVPILALTASATPNVIKEITQNLKLNSPKILRMSFRRDNISYIVRQTEDKQSMLRHILQNVNGSAIVYTRTRNRCETLSEWLNQENINALPYHGGMDNFTRSQHQDSWINGKTRVIVATNAFGMGIDKPDVRIVIHYDLCESLEAYYQEAGRAGRDGKPAYAVIITSNADKTTVKRRIQNEFPDINTIKKIYDDIFVYLKIPYDEGLGLKKQFDLNNFSKRYKYFPLTVINAIKILEINGYLKLTEPLDNPTRIIFEINREELYEYNFKNTMLNRIISAILRNYPGVFTEYKAINEVQLADYLATDVKTISELLLTLSRKHIIRYIPSSHTQMLVLTEDRIPIPHLFISPQSFLIRRETSMQRALMVVEYAEQTSKCRSLILQNYFGDNSCEGCGKCDICREKRTKPVEYTDSMIVKIISESPHDIKQLVKLLKTDSDFAVERIQQLTKQGVIKQDEFGIITLAKHN